MSTNDFYKLDPSKVFDAIESLGLEVTGRYLQLNSYENRVFDVSIEEDTQVLGHDIEFGASSSNHKSVIAKFYRPNRWSNEAIRQEHLFLMDLNSAGIKAVSPFEFNSQSVFTIDGIYFCLFPKAYGRMPQELGKDDLESIGRTLARLHNVGDLSVADKRLLMNVENYGDIALDHSLEFIYPELKSSYIEIADLFLDELSQVLPQLHQLRIHGDCHKGNILQTDPREGSKEYFFVDFDDFCNGPAVQDLWMLLADSKNIDPAKNPELKALLSGYKELRSFNGDDLKYIPLFQGLRIIYYAGWIARRWKDPSFHQIFPNYLEYNYWSEEIASLNEIWKNYREQA